ncbi:MAG: hypothetical protein ABSG75_09620 [Syntrophales bacterium]|jgi:hypothetical protein
MLGEKPGELLNLQGKEIRPVIRKLNAFNERVREDIEKKLISEAEGQELIVRATIMVSMLTTT